MAFSNRTRSGVSEPNPLSRLLEKKKRQGRRLLDLTESNPTRCGFKALEASALEALKDPANWRYEPDPRGLLAAREAVCAYYAGLGAHVKPDRVFLTSGTSEAYSHLFHLLCDPGDEVLCRKPAYPLVDHLAAYADARTRHFSGAPDGDPKAVVAVNPANPTGAYLNKFEWEKLERFCREKNAALIADEVFFDFAWRPQPGTTGASRRDALHFTLGGVSKLLGLPQMKLAWIAVTGPEKEAAEACGRLEAVADSFLSVSAPSQNALPKWLKHKDAFVSELMERVRANFDALRARGLDTDPPEGGWYALVRLPKGADDEKTALRLLEEKDLLVHPGYLFDLEEEQLIVSLLPEPAQFAEAAAVLSESLAV